MGKLLKSQTKATRSEQIEYAKEMTEYDNERVKNDIVVLNAFSIILKDMAIHLEENLMDGEYINGMLHRIS